MSRAKIGRASWKHAGIDTHTAYQTTMIMSTKTSNNASSSESGIGKVARKRVGQYNHIGEGGKTSPAPLQRPLEPFPQSAKSVQNESDR